MARYRQSDAAEGQGLFLHVNLKDQLLPGTFERMLDEIIGTKIDLSIFDRKYNNDQTGASAVPPAALLKLVIYGYSKGLNSSREIWGLCRENMVAKALTGNMSIHWTTIASFISGNNQEFEEVFVMILAYCNELKLIGGETFAIDGCRLPSNASMAWTGKQEDLEKRLAMYQRMAEKHLEKHKRKDERGESDDETRERAMKRQARLHRQMDTLGGFLGKMVKKRGKENQEISSNVTDNESGQIRVPGGGYIQGYIGLAVADAKSQVIVSAEAVGSSNECEHLPEMLRKSVENMEEVGVKELPEGRQRRVLADKGYFSEDNLQACEDLSIEGIIPDSQEKKRQQNAEAGENRKFDIDDFVYHEEEDCYECPQGKILTYKGLRRISDNGKEKKEYRANAQDCRACPCFSQCIKSKKEQGKCTNGKALMITPSGDLCRKMREKFEQEEYKERYAYRIQIIEPVFANIEHSKGLDHFTLRGKNKVNGQWLLYCILHNLGKCRNARNKQEKTA